jgi:general secretion pathway protein G
MVWFVSGRGNNPKAASGFSLVELIVAVAILSTLALMALPIARFQVKRAKEQQLRETLWTIRDALDRYKDAADHGGFLTKVDTFGYPPDLETLVKDVQINGKKVHFLNRMPVDPMTGKDDWDLRSMQDDPDSTSWGGQNVFDVHSQSQEIGLNGIKYSAW